MSAIIFGNPWDDPICEGAIRADVPVGLDCLICERPVARSDHGLLLPIETPSGPAVLPAHWECYRNERDPR